ncbi:MAG TPA: hypothetical protein VHL77_12790 [Ferruginibacter sp.]|jgi:hypothetical protein|nr:hypothetical protein [Ferruginibacter sp.]
MLYGHAQYNLRKAICCVGALLLLMMSAGAQTNKLVIKKDTSHLNPLLHTSFKKPLKKNTQLDEYIKPGKHELMYWPNYPLTYEQIAERDRLYDRSFGQQVVEDALGSYLNAIIYGRKKVVASAPKF